MGATNPEVRPFRPGDEDAFRRLNEEWITRYFRLEEKEWKMLGHPEVILDAGGQILFAVSGDEPVGCCALVPLGHATFEISKMAVTESHQGRGIGRLHRNSPYLPDAAPTWFKIRNRSYSQWVGREELFEQRT